MTTQTIEKRLKKLERTETAKQVCGVYIFNPKTEILGQFLASGKYMLYLPDNGRDVIE
ncbi:hypothetical protein [Methanococcoides seepicolus]|uniref:Uncharacterized protein n=1 Tax=Methanococcoides seepicolus TaxID=2828780 RepID=A0A9E4ZH18_9EURY|nr:hypothetical protein [Methanococcoides seepicolus]MCM1987936.1 hypothetical protein [Methanococcoides seepicolus]